MEGPLSRYLTLAASLPALALGVLLTGCDTVDSENDTVNRQDIVATNSVDQSIQVSGQEALYIQNVNGDVEIEGAGAGSAVRIQAQLVVGSDSRSDAERWLEKMHVRIEKQTRVIAVVTDAPNDAAGRRLEVHYQVRLPEGLGVEINHINGQITVSDVVGHVDVNHVNGRIVIENLRGTSNVHLVNGSIECHMYLDPDGFAFLQTVNGAIDLQIPNNTSARLHATTSNGKVRFENLTIGNESGSDQDRSGWMGEGDGQIELTAVNGTITVRGM